MESIVAAACLVEGPAYRAGMGETEELKLNRLPRESLRASTALKQVQRSLPEVALEPRPRPSIIAGYRKRFNRDLSMRKTRDFIAHLTRVK